MKERKGTVARLAGLAEGVAAGARRRQRERAPRVLLYDAEGQPRPLAPDDPSFDAVVSAAQEMLDLGARVRRPATVGEPPGGAPSTSGVSVPQADPEPEPESRARGGKRDEGRGSRTGRR